MDIARVDIRRLESRITEEHLEIRAVVDKLQTLTDPNTILIVLEDLHRKMENHFLREEGDRGLYAIIEELAPDETERVDALLREHRLLMTGLIRLIRDCRTLLNEPLARLMKRSFDLVFSASGYFEKISVRDVSIFPAKDASPRYFVRS